MVLLEVIREKESPLTGAWGIMRSRKGLADDTRGKKNSQVANVCTIMAERPLKSSGTRVL